MTDAEVGQYIRLMCIQANKGHVTEKDLLHTCKTLDSDTARKFNKKPDGTYVNLVLSEILAERRAFTESRRNNRKGKKQPNTRNTSVPLVVNVNKDIDVIEIGIKKESSISIRAKYVGEKPRRIYDLQEYFTITGQIEDIIRAGWNSRFADFMTANPGRVFDDDEHVYNSLKKFNPEQPTQNGRPVAFKL